MKLFITITLILFSFSLKAQTITVYVNGKAQTLYTKAGADAAIKKSTDSARNEYKKAIADLRIELSKKISDSLTYSKKYSEKVALSKADSVKNSLPLLKFSTDFKKDTSVKSEVLISIPK